MTPAVNPPDSSPRRPLAVAALAFAILAGGAVALGSLGGCSKPPGRPPEDQGPAGPKGDPWKVAASRLRKDTDPAATKAALGALGGEKLPATPPEFLSSGLVPLSAADREEIGGPAFTAYDSSYLADCLYLRDAARSLALAGVPPEEQADLAFAWVCRQVYLQPWPRAVGEGFEPTALPPVAVLRRGSGSGLERMYVFLALLQQLELDACLIGGPEAGNMQSREGPALTYPYISHVRVQRGPFWAVGMRIGDDVRLYDPWRGTVFPARLNELKAKPEAAKAWFEDKANLSGVTIEDARKATVFLAVPVNSLSARMAAFETNLKAELAVKVAFDPKALEAKRAAFRDPKPAYWNPPGDPYAYGRTARSFAAVDAGGTDANPVGARLSDAAYRDQIPVSVFDLPPNLKSLAARQRIGGIAATALAGAFIEPPNPRERIQRGQFQDAAKDIVAKQEAFASGLERLRLNRDADQQIREWIATADGLYFDLTRAQTLSKNKEEEAAASAAVESHWKQPGAQFLIDRASSEVGRAEASLLLALCKHEQAERLQVRLERANAAEMAQRKADASDAWKTALSAWRTYEQVSSAHAGFPGRAAHGKALAARAAKLAEPEAKK